MESFGQKGKIKINEELRFCTDEKNISFTAQKIELNILYNSKSDFAIDMKKIADQLFLTLFLDQKTPQLITYIAKNISSFPKKKQNEFFENWDQDTIGLIMPDMHHTTSAADKLHWSQTVHGHKDSIQIFQLKSELLLPYVKEIKIE